MTPPKTRNSLILQLQSRGKTRAGNLESDDVDAWHDFVATYESFLQSLVRRRGVPQAHVADVCQTILLAVLESIDGWTDDGRGASFRRWIAVVARNVTLKYLASHQRETHAAGGSEALRILNRQTNGVEDAFATQFEFELIIWAAGRVKNEFLESSWQAFWATTIENREIAEVAKELSLSPGSIYMSRSRIMRRIRQIVSEVMQ